MAEFESVVPDGVETEAVLANAPVALNTMSAVRVKVTLEPVARLTVLVMLPVPDTVAHDAPAVAAQVQVAFVSAPGRVSFTVAPTMLDGPALVTTIE